jgi:hypothetical protein
VFVGALLGAAWALVPLLTDLKFVGTSEVDFPFYANSWGARRVLGWLVTGRLFDEGRAVPVITILLAVGVIWCILRFRRDALARTILCFFIVNLLLYFGRPTLGPVLDLVPFTHDIVLHRFIMGVHIGGLLLAALGASACVRGAWRLYVGSRNRIDNEVKAVAKEGAALRAVVDRAKQLGGGRLYAGSPNDYGGYFQLGANPVSLYLLEYDAQQIGLPGRVASLSTDTEELFDPDVPADYDLFGVRYLILPTPVPKPVPDATRIMTRGRFALWQVPDGGGYLGIYDTVGPPIVANRANLGSRTKQLVASNLPADHTLRPVAFGDDPAAKPTATADAVPSSIAGTVADEHDAPDDGIYTGNVSMKRKAVVVLKASYHGRWHAYVDGAEQPTQMVAPSLVGVEVGPGTHRVKFVYEPYPSTSYALLFGISILTIVALAVGPRIVRQRRAHQAAALTPTNPA